MSDGANDIDGSSERIPAGLARDMALLRALSEAERETGDGLGVMRLAERTGRDKSQVSRALTALEKVGFVERDPSSLRYRLGYGLYVLATRGIERELISVAHPHLQRLADDLGETSFLCVLAGDGVLTLDSVSPPHHTFRSGWVGRIAPAHRCAIGRVLLGDCSKDFVFNRFATTRFRTDAPSNLIHSVRSFWEQIQVAREVGYAEEDEELEADLVGAAAPVFDGKGKLVAGICTSAPKQRHLDRLTPMAKRVKAAADAVTADLGGTP